MGLIGIEANDLHGSRCARGDDFSESNQLNRSGESRERVYE